MPKCDGYYGAAAQLMTVDRRVRQRKLIKRPGLAKRVIEQTHELGRLAGTFYSKNVALCPPTTMSKS